MPLKTGTTDEPSLNLTPMIDVVFLLIIFFMVGARFTQEAQEQQFQVQLPTAAPVETLGRQPDPLVITVTGAGQASIAGRAYTVAELRQFLVRAREAYADQAVIIRGDAGGSYQSVVDVMSLCHAAQIRRFSLAFQPLEGGGSGQP
ncbi:MAG: Biopolymer transport protein ExbD [Planctomycetota bacterium]|jgi:biopolymer transport protein ExbD